MNQRTGGALLALGAIALTVLVRRPRARKPVHPYLSAARSLSGAAGALAGCVLADSALEHYRGSFHNPAMWAPLASACLSSLAGTHGVSDPRASAHRSRQAAHTLAAAVGTAGTLFHLYNIGKRPGGTSFLNLFYGAPIGAPAALVISGLLGLAAESVRMPQLQPRLWHLPAGRALAALTAVALAGSAGEAALLHFRGAYHNPAMFLPVTLPPVGAVLLGRAALARRARPQRLARMWMRLCALLGGVGTLFHAYGVSRNMGGWRNWTQNVLNGPPLPAPPSFSALALAGLAALDLIEKEP